MGDRRTYLTNEIVKYSQKLDQKGFGANHDGNISAKLDDTILATPTAVSKDNVTDEIIITLDSEGKKISGVGKPFSEIKLHLAAYNMREDAKAVVHAHPPFATARGLVGTEIIPNLPEAIVSIGDVVPVIPFSMPGSSESIDAVKQAFETYDVIMIAGNGVLAVGESVEQAYLRLELVEHLAKIQFYANQMGEALTLSDEDITKLLEKRAAAGLGPKARIAEPTEKKPQQSTDKITDLIVDEIKKALSNSEDSK